MKKLVCLLLTALMICPLLAACTGTTVPTTEPTKTTANGEQPTEQPTDNQSADPTKQTGGDPTAATTEQPTEQPTAQPTKDPTPSEQPTEDPTPTDGDYRTMDTVTFDDDSYKYYEIKTVDGVNFEHSGTKIKKATAPEEAIWNIDSVETPDGRKTSVLFAGDDPLNGLYADKLMPNAEVKIDRVAYPMPAPKSRWLIVDNGDQTYKFVSVANPVFAITYKNKNFVLDVVENAVSFTITEKSFTPTKYALWVSEKGDTSVRLPYDVVDQIYNRMRREFDGVDVAEAKQHIDDRMQLFAEDVQKTYDSLIDLTGFVPYKHIYVWAFEHQGVMAGVVGGCPEIFVNVDWYVDDMVKMVQRWDDPAGRKEDYNFCILHEMGHMFDWDRGWNFESEMETDLKASYVLYAHQNDEYGAWAAPAEYSWDKIWNIDTIDVGGYSGLSATMVYQQSERDGQKVTRFTYSIYRSAQMYTSYVKYCEATEGLSGYEGLKRTFHWYQENGLTASGNSRQKIFERFNEKLEEFCGLNVESFMLSNYNHRDWQATVANNSGKAEQQKNADGKPNGYLIITEPLEEPTEEPTAEPAGD